MDTRATHLVTNLLHAVGRGEGGAGERLMVAVYDELRRMAAEQMAHEAGPRTLQPTALVHEAYLRLVAGGDGTFENRRHFFSAAATAMQRILVESARRRGALKRGGRKDQQEGTEETEGSGRGRKGESDPHPSPLPRREREREWAVEEIAVFDQDPGEVLDVSGALDELAQRHPDLGEVVRLRYFVGLGVEETAEVLGASPRTIANRWQMARAWLFNALREA